MHTTEVKFGPLLASGTLLGLGIGGFLNSIIFHHLFQTHNMLSGRVYPDTLEKLKLNLFWDGVFYTFLWTMIAIGITILWQACLNPYTPKSSRAFSGSIFLGAGLFNTIEGFINHILLGVHHVIENGTDKQKLFWDCIYIGAGLVIAIIGRVFVTQGKRIFYHSQIKSARLKEIRFNPAFIRRKHLYPKQEDTLQ